MAQDSLSYFKKIILKGIALKIPKVIIISMTTEQLAFRALADPTRREILRLLNRRDMTIGEITDLFPITRGAVKKHLEFLVHGGLVSVKKESRKRINRLERNAFAVVTQWLVEFDAPTEDRLTALRRSVAKEWS